MPTHAAWGFGAKRGLAGTDPTDQYRELRWGNEPKWDLDVEVPGMSRRQTLVELGRLRVLVLRGPRGTVEAKLPRPYPHLGVGTEDHRIYVCGGSSDRLARARAWGPPGTRYTVLRVDYDADKGGEDVYWYHAHESPFPTLLVLPSGHAQYRGGGYHVEAAGIVG
jgi:hypothetical protein